ncbi:hypothetical protein [Nonomuraea sp. JJY05]|jgi:hypothetical protein|uniref:hypothetical protein n=1 Tax=Nonomuraea sp. JJY05 TaxID=3350255 RepID=UPI00373EF079
MNDCDFLAGGPVEVPGGGRTAGELVPFVAAGFDEITFPTRGSGGLTWETNWEMDFGRA